MSRLKRLLIRKDFKLSLFFSSFPSHQVRTAPFLLSWLPCSWFLFPFSSRSSYQRAIGSKRDLTSPVVFSAICPSLAAFREPNRIIRPKLGRLPSHPVDLASRISQPVYQGEGGNLKQLLIRQSHSLNCHTSQRSLRNRQSHIFENEF